MNGARQAPHDNAVLQRLDRLVGKWQMDASMEGQPGGRALVTFELLDGGAFLHQHAEAAPVDFEMPAEWIANSPFPIDAIVGLDTRTETFYYLYSDGRGVYRVYEMSLEGDDWRIWGQSAADFYQRFQGTFGPDAQSITGRWERSRDGQTWETDFDVTYTKTG
jgi:hypothetical protein